MKNVDVHAQTFYPPILWATVDVLGHGLQTPQWQYGLKKHSLHYWHTPRSPMSVKKSDFFLQIKVLSSCAKIAPKRHKLQKSSKLKKKMSKKTCFLRHFRIFFNLGAILAHQTSNGMFSGSWRILWHPWGPWGRIHIENIKVLAFVFDISEWWRPLQLFSNNSK